MTHRGGNQLAGALAGACLLLGTACAERQATQVQAAEVQGAAQVQDRADVQTNTEQVGKEQFGKEKIAMQRVIVSLASTDAAVADQVDALASKFPQAKVVRVLASFRQVVMELPAAEMKLLAQEADVESVSQDRQNTSYQ